MCSLYYLIGSLVGVTSHFTPLPTGEGLGEGPAVVGVRPDFPLIHPTPISGGEESVKYIKYCIVNNEYSKEYVYICDRL